MLAFENRAPGVLVVDVIAKRERVARADEADPPWGHGGGEVVVVTEALRVGAKIDPVTVQVPVEEPAPVHPAEQRIVIRVRRGKGEVHRLRQLTRQQDETARALDEQEDEDRNAHHGDAPEQE